MTNISRRQLAKYAVEQMRLGKSSALLAKQLTSVMLVSGKDKEIELLISDIDQELEDRGLLATAHLRSVHPISENLRRQLIEEVKKLAGVQDVALDQRIDKEVLGGFRIETANHAWDKSTAKILMNIRETA